ncbi:MAG: hypothetical protein PVJ57_10755 [Phycisphaerae bacterium]|jgi:hypothetical protein
MFRLLATTTLLTCVAFLSACNTRPSLEKTGYTAFVFAIDTSDLPADRDVSAEVAAAVLKRLDPDERFGVVCTPLSRDQIEVRVQHAPQDVQALGRAFEESLARLAAANVTPEELLAALVTVDGRDAALEQLVRGHPTRKAALAALATAYDAWKESGFEPPYQKVLDDVLATNLPVDRLRRALEFGEPRSSERKQWLADAHEHFPHLKQQLDNVVARYDAWYDKGKGKYLENPAWVKRLLRGLGVLEFRVLPEPAPDNPTKYDLFRRRLHEHGPAPVPGDEFGWFRVDDPVSFFNLDGPAELTDFDPCEEPRFVADRVDDDYYILAYLTPDQGLLAKGQPWHLLQAKADYDAHGRPAVSFTLDSAGGSLFEKLTARNIDRPLCILVDDVAYSAATIRTKIRSSGQITGDFTLVKTTYLARLLNAQLAAPLKFPPVSEREVAPQP